MHKAQEQGLLEETWPPSPICRAHLGQGSVQGLGSGVQGAAGLSDAHLLLGSTPISHEYYDPAEFMEGSPQEVDRMDELEYEVSSARLLLPFTMYIWLNRGGCGQVGKCHLCW